MRKAGCVALVAAFLMVMASVAPAADDVMKRAQGMFKPIPAKAPEVKGKSFTPA
jgi:hypothetical protein